MAFENPTREEIADILRNAGNIAVVGLSDRPDRTSHMVSLCDANARIPDYPG